MTQASRTKPVSDYAKAAAANDLPDLPDLPTSRGE